MSIGIEAGGFSTQRLGESDLAALDRLCLRSADFYALIGDEPASRMAAAEILGPLADPYAHGTKHVFGMFEAGELIAVAELLEGHPSPDDWFIGLLLVDPSRRRSGIGRTLATAILDWIAGNGGTAVRLVVQQQNASALRFWQHMGFRVETETVTRVGSRPSDAWVLILSQHGTTRTGR